MTQNLILLSLNVGEKNFLNFWTESFFEGISKLKTDFFTFTHK